MRNQRLFSLQPPHLDVFPQPRLRDVWQSKAELPLKISQAAARAGPEQTAAVIAGQSDPLAHLVAAGARFARGQASPQLVQLAVDTASRQGWRRPLLAWLGVQEKLAEGRGDEPEAARLRRRMAIVNQEKPRD